MPHIYDEEEVNQLNFVQRYLNPSIFPVVENEDGSVSTHLMSSAEVDGKQVVYPNIVQDADGNLTKMEGRDALMYAMEHGEFIEFPTAGGARRFAEGGYKKNWAKGDFDKAIEEGDPQKAYDIRKQAKVSMQDQNL